MYGLTRASRDCAGGASAIGGGAGWAMTVLMTAATACPVHDWPTWW